MTASSPSRSAHPASQPSAHNHIITKPSVPSTTPFLPAPRLPHFDNQHTQLCVLGLVRQERLVAAVRHLQVDLAAALALW